ncbi:MAG: hypothetical protein JRE81_16145 [Deltaproteobacteria bacterium]|jgi:hypothetical protein|nr:hypothetical protein [Deltaproteobacteria bacterium]
MEHKLATAPGHTALAIAGIVIALASGCGDQLGVSGSAFGSALASHVKDEIGGPQVELTVVTSCEGMESTNLETRCEGVRSAEIEVFFDGSSLVFDFSNAPRSGVISDRGFEGYVLTRTEHSMLRALRDASVDGELSNVDADMIQIELDGTSIAVDFRGLDYDDATFVKIDLAFEAQ